MSMTELGSYRRRVVLVTQTPESNQPYSVMHRALYANIVGQDTFYGFPHGCTIKQLDGEDYVVDHVTRMAQPVRKIPALNPEGKTVATISGQLINGIIKLGEVMKNLESRNQIARTQLATSTHTIAKHQATIQTFKAKALTIQPPAPIADVITQRANNLRSVRGLLSLVAQASKLASTHAARDLLPHQLIQLQKASPVIHSKYVAWKSGHLVLPETEEEAEAMRQAQTEEASKTGDEPMDEAEYEGQEGLYDEDHALDSDEERAAHPESEVKTIEGDNADTPAVVEDALPSTNEEESDTAVVVEAVSEVVASDRPEAVAHGDNPHATVATAALEPAEEEWVIVEETTPMINQLVEQIPVIEETAAPLQELASEVVAPTSLEPLTDASSEPTIATKASRAPSLCLPDCTQPNIVILCTVCKAFLPFDEDSLATHEASEEHQRHANGMAQAPVSFTSEIANPPIALPSFVSSRPVPKRHVRVGDDNTFLDSYAVVRTGCSSCQRDVGIDEVDSHAATQEHLDYLDE